MKASKVKVVGGAVMVTTTTAVGCDVVGARVEGALVLGAFVVGEEVASISMPKVNNIQNIGSISVE